MNMKINIGFTGITGMLGKNFLDYFFKNRLIMDKFNIVGFTRGDYNKQLNKYNTSNNMFSLRSINYYDKENIKNNLESIDILIHSAGVTKGNFYKEFEKGNIEVTNNLVQTIKEEKIDIKKFIFISTQSVLGPSDNYSTINKEYYFIDEDAKRNPISSYGVSKAKAEELIINSNLNWTIIRFPTIFGKYEMDSLQLFKIANKGIIIDTSWQDFVLSYILAEDAVELIFKIIETSIENDKTNQKILHLCYDEPIKIKDYFREVIKISNKKVLVSIPIPRIIFKIASIISTLNSIFKKKATIINKEKINEFIHTKWLLSNSKTKEILNINTIERKAGFTDIYKWYNEEGLL